MNTNKSRSARKTGLVGLIAALYLLAASGTANAWNPYWFKLAGETTDQPAATTVYLGKLYTFVKRSTGENFIRYRIYDGSSWSGWTYVPSGTTDKTPAVTVASGKLWLFVKGGADHRLYMRYLDVSVWSDWSEVPGGGFTNEGPAACTNGSGEVMLMVKGNSDYNIYYNIRRTSGFWTGWSRASWSSGQMTDRQPACVWHPAQQKMYLFFNLAGGSGICVMDWTSTGGWSAGSTLGSILSTPHGPTATYDDDTVYVYGVQTTTGKIFETSQLPGGWFDTWYEIGGGGSTDRAAAASTFEGWRYVFVEGTSPNNEVFYNLSP